MQILGLQETMNTLILRRVLVRLITMKLYKSYLLLLLLVFSCSKEGTSEKTIIDENGNQFTVDTSANKKSVGDSANDLLSEQNFNSLVLEIFYVEDFKPTTSTIWNFESFISERLNKSGNITVKLNQIVSPGKTIYSITDIKDIEENIRTAYNLDGQIAVFGLYLDGEYSENTENGSVLGVAYRNTSFVIFEKTIKEFSGQPLAPSTTVLETTVLNHEFGHLLGLVNAGTTPQSDHQDEVHGRHCDAGSCLMNWTAETGEGLLNSLSGGAVPDLDEQCISDLQANGGK